MPHLGSEPIFHSDLSPGLNNRKNPNVLILLTLLVECSSLTQPASKGARNTRSTSDPLNVKRRHGRLELRKNFFTVRVTEPWNNIPSQVKQVRTKSGFKSAYAKCRGDISQ